MFAALRPEAVPQSLDVVFSEVVVLIQNGDLGVGMVGENESGVDMRFGLVVGVKGDGPWEILWVGEARCTGRGQKLRHFFVVEIFLNRGIGWRADDLEGGENFIALDQLADL